MSHNFPMIFNKRFDWIGIERTFKNVFEMLKRKVESGYKEYKNLYVKSKYHI